MYIGLTRRRRGARRGDCPGLTLNPRTVPPPRVNPSFGVNRGGFTLTLMAPRRRGVRSQLFLINITTPSNLTWGVDRFYSRGNFCAGLPPSLG